MLSKSVEYAVKSLVLINNKSSHINVDLISIELNIPKNFTSKILKLLTKKGYIISRKGPGGGFLKNNYSNTLKQLITDIDGSFTYNRCIINNKECDDISHCPLHDYFKGIRKKILNECCSYNGCERDKQPKYGALIPTEDCWVCPCGEYKQEYRD